MTKSLKAVAMIGALAAGIGFAPSANAAPAGNVVTFGDSYFANPTVEGYWIAKAPQQVQDMPGVPKVSHKNGCAHDPDGIPAKIARKSGRHVDDYSCAGAVLYTPRPNNLDEQIEGAIRDGALNPNTSFIAIQIGFNDTYVNAVNLPSVREQWWKDASDAAVAKIRAHAPKAKIGFVNYPTISEPGTSKQCLIHVDVAGQKVDAGVPAFWIEQGEIETSKYAHQAAVRHNAEFIDVRSKTTDRHECTPDNKRIVAGMVDNRTQDYNLPVHLNNAGKEIIANEIVARM